MVVSWERKIPFDYIAVLNIHVSIHRFRKLSALITIYLFFVSRMKPKKNRVRELFTRESTISFPAARIPCFSFHSPFHHTFCIINAEVKVQPRIRASSWIQKFTFA